MFVQSTTHADPNERRCMCRHRSRHAGVVHRCDDVESVGCGGMCDENPLCRHTIVCDVDTDYNDDGDGDGDADADDADDADA